MLFRLTAEKVNLFFKCAALGSGDTLPKGRTPAASCLTKACPDLSLWPEQTPRGFIHVRLVSCRKTWTWWLRGCRSLCPIPPLVCKLLAAISSQECRCYANDKDARMQVCCDFAIVRRLHLACGRCWAWFCWGCLDSDGWTVSLL